MVAWKWQRLAGGRRRFMGRSDSPDSSCAAQPRVADGRRVGRFAPSASAAEPEYGCGGQDAVARLVGQTDDESSIGTSGFRYR